MRICVCVYVYVYVYVCICNTLAYTLVGHARAARRRAHLECAATILPPVRHGARRRAGKRKKKRRRGTERRHGEGTGARSHGRREGGRLE
jgi:hypothetical protein